MMEYLVIQVRRAAEDHQAWTAVTGPEGNPEPRASGQEGRASLDPLDRSGRRVRRESPGTSPTATASRVCQVYQEPTVNLVSEAPMVHLVSLVQEALKGTPARPVLPVLQG